MKFRTAYCESRRYFGYTGNGTEEKYERVYDSDLKKSVCTCTGVTDVYKLIQTASEGADLKSLLARYIAGDTEVLGVDPGFYPDLTKAPTSLIDAKCMLEKSRSIFDGLDAATKKLYKNNFNIFLEDMHSGNFKKLADAAGVQSKPMFTEEQIKFIKENLNAKSE